MSCLQFTLRRPLLAPFMSQVLFPSSSVLPPSHGQHHPDAISLSLERWQIGALGRWSLRIPCHLPLYLQGASFGSPATVALGEHAASSAARLHGQGSMQSRLLGTGGPGPSLERVWVLDDTTDLEGLFG